MTPEQAGKILNSYGKAIEKIKEEDIVQPLSDLPCSPAKIRYAHFVYSESLIKKGLFTKEIGETLKETYGMLNSRFIEDADEINEAIRQYKDSNNAQKKNEARKIIERHGLSSFLPDTKMMIELHNFFADCLGKYN